MNYEPAGGHEVTGDIAASFLDAAVDVLYLEITDLLLS
jgi:hypothetical protein|tara:strand:- start:502 stop:615 length:114 start_codon:yes stop_codon:yes gene_type:complete